MTDFNPQLRRQSDFTPSLVRRTVSRLVPLAEMLPVSYPLNFADCSRWNTVDIRAHWNAGYRVIALKATEGVDWVDPTFERRWNEALECGFLVIAYHFFRSNLDGVRQAEWHLENTRELEEQGKGYVISNQVDVETSDGVSVSVRVPRVLQCLNAVELEVKRVPGCYSSAYLWKTLIGDTPWARLYRNWCASWTSAAYPTLPVGWTQDSTWYWQVGISGKHSWLPGSVPGCTGQIDYNRSFKTLEELKRVAGAVDTAEPELTLEQRVDLLEQQMDAVKGFLNL